MSFSPKNFKAVFKGISYYHYCADRQNEDYKYPDTDQKSCSYQIIELDIYFRTQQAGFFRWIMKPLNKNPNISKLVLIVGKPGMLPRSVWVCFNERAKQTPSLLHTFLVFKQSKSRHATWGAATVFSNRSQPGLLETKIEEFEVLVCSTGTATESKTSCKFSAVNISD